MRIFIGKNAVKGAASFAILCAISVGIGVGNLMASQDEFADGPRSRILEPDLANSGHLSTVKSTTPTEGDLLRVKGLRKKVDEISKDLNKKFLAMDKDAAYRYTNSSNVCERGYNLELTIILISNPSCLSVIKTLLSMIRIDEKRKNELENFFNSFDTGSLEKQVKDLRKSFGCNYDGSPSHNLCGLIYALCKTVCTNPKGRSSVFKSYTENIKVSLEDLKDVKAFEDKVYEYPGENLCRERLIEVFQNQLPCIYQALPTDSEINALLEVLDNSDGNEDVKKCIKNFNKKDVKEYIKGFNESVSFIRDRIDAFLSERSKIIYLYVVRKNIKFLQEMSDSQILKALQEPSEQNAERIVESMSKS